MCVDVNVCAYICACTRAGVWVWVHKDKHAHTQTSAPNAKSTSDNILGTNIHIQGVMYSAEPSGDPVGVLVFVRRARVHAHM